MLLPVYLDLLAGAERALAVSFRMVATGHAAEADVFHLCNTLGEQCEQHVDAIAPFAQRFGSAGGGAPERVGVTALGAARSGPLGMLRDLQDLYALASLVESTWTVVQQAGQAVRDAELLQTVSAALKQTELQLAWLRTHLKEAAAQALVAAS